MNSEHAAALLLFIEQCDYLLASRIEMPRLLAEEVGDLPFEPQFSSPGTNRSTEPPSWTIRAAEELEPTPPTSRERGC